MRRRCRTSLLMQIATSNQAKSAVVKRCGRTCRAVVKQGTAGNSSAASRRLRCAAYRPPTTPQQPAAAATTWRWPISNTRAVFRRRRSSDTVDSSTADARRWRWNFVAAVTSFPCWQCCFIIVRLPWLQQQPEKCWDPLTVFVLCVCNSVEMTYKVMKHF